MKALKIFTFLSSLWLLFACADRVENATELNRPAPVYPDYVGVTIPKNIAPLNFLLRDSAEEVSVTLNGKTAVTSEGNKVEFALDDWHDFLRTHAGQQVRVKVYAKHRGEWFGYPTFHWTIANDTIDPCLTYRLIEPDYEVWNHLQIQQRNLTNFETSQLVDHQLEENRCMNCHEFSNRDPQLSMVYVRGKGGGAILNDHGRLSKLDIKAATATDSMVSSSVYYGFSPSGRYVVFSTNVIIPAFHAQANKRLEVYDQKSDVYVADLKTYEIYLSPLLADTTTLETFPTFSPDGRSIYYCAANSSGLASKNLHGLQYSLVRIGFDEKTGRIGSRVDTLVNASHNDGSQ